MLNLLRVYCVEMVHLQHDFSSEVDGYYKVEEVVPAQALIPLHSTFGPLEHDAMITAVLAIVEFYRGIAPPLAASHGIVYPVDLDRVLSHRLETLRD